MDIKDIIENAKDLAQEAKEDLLEGNGKAEDSMETCIDSKNSNEHHGGLLHFIKKAFKEKQKGNMILIILVIAILVCLFVTFFVNPFHFKFGFTNRKTEIEKTANVVTEIRKISVPHSRF